VYRFRDRIIQKGTAAKKLYLVYEGGALVNISYGVKSGEKTQLPLKTEDKKVSKDIKELSSGFLIGLYECRNSVPFDYNVFSSQSSTVLFGLDHEVGTVQQIMFKLEVKDKELARKLRRKDHEFRSSIGLQNIASFLSTLVCLRQMATG
jgi:hypothetical protein